MVMIFSSISFFSPVLFYSSMHLVYAFMHFGTQCNVVVSTNMIRKKKMKNETPLSIWRNSCTHGTQYIHQMPSLHYYVSFHIQTQSFQQSRWSIFFLYLRFNRQIEKQSNERNYGTAWCFVTHTENEEDWYFCFFFCFLCLTQFEWYICASNYHHYSWYAVSFSSRRIVCVSAENWRDQGDRFDHHRCVGRSLITAVD